jgi:hypothetical protein
MAWDPISPRILSVLAKRVMFHKNPHEICSIILHLPFNTSLVVGVRPFHHYYYMMHSTLGWVTVILDGYSWRLLLTVTLTVTTNRYSWRSWRLHLPLLLLTDTLTVTTNRYMLLLTVNLDGYTYRYNSWWLHLPLQLTVILDGYSWRLHLPLQRLFLTVTLDGYTYRYN